MEFLERMNVAMDAIERQLAEDIDLRQLAHAMGCSEYHLSRLFPFVTGQGLGQYIRRRRMTQAALDLQQTETDLLTLAVTYGYSSVDAFSRAFRDVHGVSPSDVRTGRRAARSFPPLRFSLTILGAEAMTYRLLHKEAFRIVGISRRVPLVYTGPNPDIDALWASVTPQQVARWKALSDTDPRGIVSASTNFSEDRMSGPGATLDYYIGAATTKDPGDEPASLDVEAGFWAVFEVVGDFPTRVQATWGRIYAEWFPTSKFEVRPGPEILWNEGPDTTKPDFRSEIWIPVIKKEE